MTIYIGYKSSVTTMVFSLALISLICYKKYTNIPSKELSFIEDYNEHSKNVHYDIDKEKDICQISSSFSDDKINKNTTTDKNKTDLNNSSDINGTSYKQKSSKYYIRRELEVRSVKDYVNPCERDENLDYITMHVRTNDLNSQNNPERVTKSIVNFEKSMSFEKRRLQLLESYPQMANRTKGRRICVRLLQSIILITIVLILRKI